MEPQWSRGVNIPAHPRPYLLKDVSYEKKTRRRKDMAPRSGRGTKKNVYSRRAAIRTPYHKLIYKMKTRHDSPVWVFLTLTLLAWFAEVRAQAQVQDIADIHIRDPFILPDAKTGTYYMYRSSGIRNGKGETIGGVEAFKSKDLVNWEGPIRVFTVPEDNWITGDVWAPEVHRYKGKYYLFATLNSEDRKSVV